MDVSRKGNRYNTFSVSRILNKVVRGICSCGSNCHYSYTLFGKSDMETRCVMEIIHDRAAEFLPDVLQDTTSIMGLTQLPTSRGHPQYLPYCIRCSKPVNCIRYHISSCINSENFVKFLWLHKKLKSKNVVKFFVHIRLIFSVFACTLLHR